MERLPIWLEAMEQEDLAFIKRFVLSSGSLKEMAGQYGVSYPTVRLRLDRLIQKIQIQDQQPQEPYVALIKTLAVEGKVDMDTAKMLIQAYRKEGKDHA